MKEVHQRQRCRVGPLQIVEENHERPLAAELRQELEHRLEEVELRRTGCRSSVSSNRVRASSPDRLARSQRVISQSRT